MKVKLKKCKNKECGLMFRPKRLTTEVVCSFQCSIDYAKQKREAEESREWKKTQKVMREQLKTKSEHEKDLQKIFNEFIRLRDAGQPCISCGSIAGTYTVNAGHYFPAGTYKNLRFDEENVHNQCVHCNQHKHGNISEYSIHLPNRIGAIAFQLLTERRLVERHYSIPELIELKVIYKDKIRQMKGIK